MNESREPTAQPLKATGKGFDLGRLVKPQGQLPTSLGTIYLYRCSSEDLSAFAALSRDDAPIQRIRSLLTRVASLRYRDRLGTEHTPLTAQQVEQLTADEVEQLAGAYLQMPGVSLFVNQPAGDRQLTPRGLDEPASAFLGRALQHRLEQEQAEWPRLQDSFPRSFVSAVEDLWRQDKKWQELLGKDSAIASLSKHASALDHVQDVGKAIASQTLTPFLDAARDVDLGKAQLSCDLFGGMVQDDPDFASKLIKEPELPRSRGFTETFHLVRDAETRAREERRQHQHEVTQLLGETARAAAQHTKEARRSNWWQLGSLLVGVIGVILAVVQTFANSELERAQRAAEQRADKAELNASTQAEVAAKIREENERLAAYNRGLQAQLQDRRASPKFEASARKQ